jgi:heptosyltransferase II
MKILAIQNRMGIGDTVIFLPFIKAISKYYDTPVNILVKNTSKAQEFLYQTQYIDQIITLERNNKNGRHDGFIGSINLIKELKKYKFDIVFIFNSSLRYKVISKLSGIKKIYQYPLFKKKNQNLISAAKNLIKKELLINVDDNPEIYINDNLVKKAAERYGIEKKQTNILLGIGGSGPTKRIPGKTFLKVIEEILKIKDCKFFLATGKNSDEQSILTEIMNSSFKDSLISLDDLSIKDTLPIIKNCNVSICNDTSFSHLSSALGIETITLMADTPLMYGNYSSKMHPIIPDGEETVSHNTLGKDKINPDKILQKLKNILN